MTSTIFAVPLIVISTNNVTHGGHVMIEAKVTFTARRPGNVRAQQYQDLVHAPDYMKGATDAAWAAVVVTALGAEYVDINDVVVEVQEND